VLPCRAHRRPHGHVKFNTSVGDLHVARVAWSARPSAVKAEAGYKRWQFPFLANGRARALATRPASSKSSPMRVRRDPGVHIIRPMASELIAEAVVAMEFKASAEDIAPHLPRTSVAFRVDQEAALAVDKRTLNF